ncbi:MAG: AraC family transcriptional regulator [Oceanospirillaceae bacterium]|nr:AraC family transcriptional regulator [Oceanospirillaceae bacterium]
MNYLTQVQKGVDFIESNLDYDLSFGDISKKAGISQWHFQRIFRALTNETLKTYIRSRRLANALEKLLKNDQKIIEIAITAGYESQESFTRAFKKAFNLTPSEARKIGSKNLFLKKVKFDAQYLRHINQNISLTPQIYTQKRLLLVGMKTEFYSVDSEKNNIADKLPQLWGAFVPRMGEIKHSIANVAYGIIQQEKGNTDLLEYYAVVEVTSIDQLPAGMISLEIPQSTYAKFVHKGKVTNINNTINYIYSSWLLQSNRRHSYAADIEIYGSEFIPDSDQSVTHYAIPIE